MGRVPRVVVGGQTEMLNKEKAMLERDMQLTASFDESRRLQAQLQQAQTGRPQTQAMTTVQTIWRCMCWVAVQSPTQAHRGCGWLS